MVLSASYIREISDVTACDATCLISNNPLNLQKCLTIKLISRLLRLFILRLYIGFRSTSDQPPTPIGPQMKKKIEENDHLCELM